MNASRLAFLPTGSATQVTVRGTVVVNSGDEMVSAYLVSTYDFDGDAHSHLC